MMVLNWIDQAPRRVLALISVACVAMLAFGMYLQHVVGLEPCPMCIVQRYALKRMVDGLGRAGPDRIRLRRLRGGPPELAAVVPTRSRHLRPRLLRHDRKLSHQPRHPHDLPGLR